MMTDCMTQTAVTFTNLRTLSVEQCRSFQFGINHTMIDDRMCMYFHRNSARHPCQQNVCMLLHACLHAYNYRYIDSRSNRGQTEK